MDAKARLLFNSEIKRIQRELFEFRHSGVKDGWIKSPTDLFISDHFSQRLVERKLHGDIPFIKGICKYFMVKVFYENTYTSRMYRISLRGLHVGMQISASTYAEDGRKAILATAFTSGTNYDCDEVIELK